MITKIILISIFLLNVALAFGQDIKKQKIEVEKARTITSQQNTDGSSRTTGSGYKYQWRYAGEEKWIPVTRGAKNLRPILQQFPNSAKLYKQYRLIYGVGKPVSVVFIAGGMIMGGIGYLKQVDYQEGFKDPNTGEETTIVHYNNGYKALKYIGMTTFGIGLVGYYSSFYFGVKKLDASIIRYNRMIDKEVESSLNYKYEFQMGMQYNPASSLPLLSFRLKL